MATQSNPVGDHRRLHDLLLELRHRAGDPSLRKINSTSEVSVGYLSQIFAGKTAPSPEVAVRIAQALKASEREQARARYLAEGSEADRPVPRAAQAGQHRRSAWEGCPYLGLRPFEEQHATVFYGRRLLTGRLLDRLREQPWHAGMLLVLGPSGAGKSSLLRAGLMGSLAADGLTEGSRAWPRRVITPTGDPVRQLAIHLAELAAADAITVQEALTTRPEQTHLLAGQALAAAGRATGPGAHPRLVLVVDQLEELFTLTTDTAEQETFLTALHSLATGPVLPGGEPGALVVAGIRGDFLDRALAFEPIRRAAESGVFAVGAMSESELREAIVGPAAEAGVRLPGDLCAVVLDDLRERCLPVGFDCGVLPLLSQVMFVMWQARDTAGLTVEAYRRTGGVADIVRTSAERVYESLAPDRQDVARLAFIHLTAMTDGRLTRQPSTRGALRTATGSDAIDEVVEAFAAQRLVTVSDSDHVTIAHEELLRSWNRLRDWLQPSLTDQALYRALTDDVHDWQQGRRDPSYLYSGGRLLAVEDARHRWAEDPARHFPIHPDTAQFLSISLRRDRRRRRAYQAAGMVMVLLLGLAGYSAMRADENHERAISLLASGLSRSLTAENRITSERFAAAALAAGRTDESLDVAGALLADAANVLPGDSGVVKFSEDGKLLATADGYGTVRLWDPKTGNPVTEPLRGHTTRVRSVDFTPDGTVLATASEDATVRLWDTTTGEQIGLLSGHAGPVRSVDVNAAGTLVATGGEDRTVQLWGLRTGVRHEVLSGHGDTVRLVKFSPDGTRLAGYSDDRTARLWDPVTGKRVGEAVAHSGAIHSLGFDPAGRLLVTTDDAGTVRFWDTGTGRLTGAPLSTGTGPVYTAQFTHDGTWLATAGEDRTVRLWDVTTRRLVGRMTGHSGPIRNMAATTGGLLATAGDDARIRLWNSGTRRQVGLLSGHSGNVWVMRFSPDGKILATAGADRTVRLWDPATRRPLGITPPGHTDPVNAVAYSRDGSLVATGATDHRVRLWDPATRAAVGEPMIGHTGPVRAVAFSPDMRLLASAGDDATVVLWNADTRRQAAAPLRGHSGPVRAVAFSPDHKHLASAGDDGTVRLWTRDRALWHQAGGPLIRHTGPVRALAFDRGGKHLATAGVDRAVWVWDVAGRKTIAGPLPGHTGPVYAVTFDPDGKLLASAGEDGTTRLWDLAAGGSAAGDPLTGHSGPVWSVRFNRDGRSLATAGNDRTVRIWDVDQRRQLGVPLAGHTGPVYDVAWSPRAGTLASVSGDTTLRWWDTATFWQNPLDRLCDRVGGITAGEWNGHVHGEPLAEPCGD
ncbi:nSTAND1 domain-containing NTPase [Actinoplanes italicus]|uniref:nSTAND1 domain-containing NTPase n=1 Tax=Actinoplanes italicus TaxID=113567 RepID=UPI0011B1CA67|nr:AAA family ATPase [Actinoplanes italicus]